MLSISKCIHPQIGYVKQTVKNCRLLIQKYTQFWFFRKGFATSSSTTFLAWFFKKNISQLYSINWPNFIFSLPLLVDILGKRCVIIICFLVYNLMDFGINLRSGRFPILTKIQNKNVNVYRAKTVFQVQ